MSPILAAGLGLLVSTAAQAQVTPRPTIGVEMSVLGPSAAVIVPIRPIGLWMGIGYTVDPWSDVPYGETPIVLPIQDANYSAPAPILRAGIGLVAPEVILPGSDARMRMTSILNLPQFVDGLLVDSIRCGDDTLDCIPIPGIVMAPFVWIAGFEMDVRVVLPLSSGCNAGLGINPRLYGYWATGFGYHRPLQWAALAVNPTVSLEATW